MMMKKWKKTLEDVKNFQAHKQSEFMLYHDHIFFKKSTNTTQTPQNYNTFFSLLGKILKFI